MVLTPVFSEVIVGDPVVNMDSPQGEGRLFPTWRVSSGRQHCVNLFAFDRREIAVMETPLENRQMQARLHQEIQRVDLLQRLFHQRCFAFFQRNQKGQV